MVLSKQYLTLVFAFVLGVAGAVGLTVVHAQNSTDTAHSVPQQTQTVTQDPADTVADGEHADEDTGTAVDATDAKDAAGKDLETKDDGAVSSSKDASETGDATDEGEVEDGK